MNRDPDPVNARAGSPPPPVLVCFAVREEARWFRSPSDPPTEVLITGVGARCAVSSLRPVLEQRPPGLVVTCGFAGGLNPDLPLGQVVVDDTRAGRCQAVVSKLGLKRAQFTHSEHILTSPQEKSSLYTATGADVVEMESSSIVAVCCEHGVPVLVLRTISDTAEDSLPMDFNRYSKPNGDLDMGRLLLAIASRPTVIPRLMAFRRRLDVAGKSLATTLDGLLTAGDLV